MRTLLACLAFLSLNSALAQKPQPTPSATPQTPAAELMKVDAQVALSSLMTISDQHIQGFASSLVALAQSPAVQSGDWNAIRGPLSAVAQSNVAALNWFVLPDGSYWSVQNGKEAGNLSDRGYFPRLIGGAIVIGDMVLSKSTGKSVAIVAVPVLRNQEVIGALGASIYLDQLSTRIDTEMNFGETDIFFSFNSTPIVGLDWDPALIFANPTQLGPEISAAFQEMLQHDQGTVRYTFRGRERTVIYRKSNVTGWWYAYGQIPEGREGYLEPSSNAPISGRAPE